MKCISIETAKQSIKRLLTPSCITKPVEVTPQPQPEPLGDTSWAANIWQEHDEHIAAREARRRTTSSTDDDGLGFMSRPPRGFDVLSLAAERQGRTR